MRKVKVQFTRKNFSLQIVFVLSLKKKDEKNLKRKKENTTKKRNQIRTEKLNVLESKATLHWPTGPRQGSVAK